MIVLKNTSLGNFIEIALGKEQTFKKFVIDIILRIEMRKSASKLYLNKGDVQIRLSSFVITCLYEIFNSYNDQSPVI